MRTQLILEGWQYDSLKSLAEKRGTSISSVVREAVSEYLSSAETEGPGRLEELRGLVRDKSARGKDHDQHLYPRSPVSGRRAGKARARRK